MGRIRALVCVATITMRVKVDFSSLRQTKWHEYLVRLISGGLITAATGIIAKKFGPGVGGLFLAFPAIFPASATLIEKHETEKKQKKGMPGKKRAREVAAVDAAGATMGSLGLLGFGFVVWRLMPAHSPWLVLLLATVVWSTIAFVTWLAKERL